MKFKAIVREACRHYLGTIIILPGIIFLLLRPFNSEILFDLGFCGSESIVETEKSFRKDFLFVDKARAVSAKEAFRLANEQLKQQILEKKFPQELQVFARIKNQIRSEPQKRVDILTCGKVTTIVATDGHTFITNAEKLGKERLALAQKLDHSRNRLIHLASLQNTLAVRSPAVAVGDQSNPDLAELVSRLKNWDVWQAALENPQAANSDLDRAEKLILGRY